MKLELIAISNALDSINTSNTSNQQIVIFTDSKSALQHLARCASGIRGTSIAYSILNKIHLFSCSNIDLKMQWVPSHIGKRGNEEADRLAKEASTKGIEVYIEPTFTEQLFEIRKLCYDNLKNILMKEVKRREFGIKLSKVTLLVILGLIRSGHNPSRKFGYLMKKVDSPNCEVCGTLDDVHHLLVDCDKYRSERESLMLKLSINRTDIDTVMDWVLRGPQIHSTFSNLGFVKTDGYHVNDNCNSALETILNNILSEDKYLRTYRRSISFGQNIKRDLIPLLIHAKEDKTIELIVKILVNLTIPIECLLNVDLISRTDYGRYTIFEINNLLASTKVAFTDIRTSKALVDFLKKNVDVEQKTKLSEDRRTNVSNCLLLLRNILHIPENNGHLSPSYNGSAHSLQNQILWNIFSQSVDKIIIKSITVLDANYWGVTMVQLVALLYKDQHVVTLNKLLNNWLEASLSESSEDNESNTSPPDRADSEYSSLMLTSDPASDSSDNCGGDEYGDSATSMHAAWESGAGEQETRSPPFLPREYDNTGDDKCATSHPYEQDNTADDKSSGFWTANEDQTKLYEETPSSFLIDQSKDHKHVISGTSDCGYGTHIENHESISTSSNEDDMPMKKPVHQKPHNLKQRPNNKPRLCATSQDRKRKKIVKRGKANLINVQGLSLKTPTDDDISNLLKEFTVDFLLKGYNSLVQTLHSEILTNPQLQIDTSHFFWLVTYFLKFATQIELDLEHVDSVLSFEIVSYLTSEGVNLCEQFELAIKLDVSDLSPNIRRQHLVVTAIREFVQAIEVYKKNPHLDEDAREILKNLQIKMCETEDLRSMLVLLLRHFNPKYHSKQYLQDLIVTNHILLMFLDNVMKFPDYNCSTKMIDHIRQFATPEIMAQYGLLLSDYLINGEYVNDCIFTLMHHVGGELGSLITLFQPNILKTFTALWKSDFELCDEWSDLIQYVINTFVKKPSTLNNAYLNTDDGFEESKIFARPIEMMSTHSKELHDVTRKSILSDLTIDRWTRDEILALSWNYLQSKTKIDVIGKITEKLKECGIKKTRESVIKELFRQNLISRDFYERQLKGECERNMRSVLLNNESRDEEIARLCLHLVQDGKSNCLDWVQKVLLEICYAKLLIQKINLKKTTPVESDSKLLNFEIFTIKNKDAPVVSPVAYHSLIMHHSVPLVPWNCQQASICKDLKFLQLLHKLGFHMPVDTGKFFIRIPHFWSPDFMFSIAGKIRPIDKSKLKFFISELSDSEMLKEKKNSTMGVCMIKDALINVAASDNFYQIHKQNIATMVNFTPRPGPSFKAEGETEPLNWLQVVKKSQETKIVLNLESITEATEDIVMQLPMGPQECEVLSAPPPAEPADRDIYNSAFETTSVASDITRMYVPDENEKPEVTVSPNIVVEPLTFVKEQIPRNVAKRRREN